MTPELKKLLDDCLAPNSSGLCDSTFAKLKRSGGKDAIAFFKAFAHREAKKPLARGRLIETARMDAEHLQDALKRNPSTTLAKPGKAKPIDGKAKVVASDDLPSLGASITFIQDQVDEIGRRAMREALPLKLKQGLVCLKAQALLAVEDPARRGQGRKPKEINPDSGLISEEAAEEPANFNDWIQKQAISSGSAYDYMRAVEGLGLTHESTEKQLVSAYDKARKDAGGELSITKLKNLAGKPDQDDEDKEDKNTPEARAGEARVFIHNFMQRWDHGVKASQIEWAAKADLQELEEFLTTTREKVRQRIKSSK